MHILNFIFTYRISVAVLVLFFCLNILYIGNNKEIYFVALAFGMLFQGIYILNKVTDFEEDSVNIKALPLKEGNKKAAKYLAYGLFVAPFLFLVSINLPLAIFYLLVPANIGFFYSHHLPFSKLRLKKIPFAKNFISALLLWGVTLTYLPSLYFAKSLEYQSFSMFLNIALLVYVVELVWDMRDIEGDRKAGIKTFANQFGFSIAKVLALFVMLALASWSLFGSGFPLVYQASYIVSLLVIALIRQDSHAYMYQLLPLIWLGANVLRYGMRWL